MNAKNFSIAMGEVGEKYVIEAANYYKKRGTGGWMKWLGVVACLCFVIVGIFTYKGNGPVSNVKGDSCALPGADKNKDTNIKRTRLSIPEIKQRG